MTKRTETNKNMSSFKLIFILVLILLGAYSCFQFEPVRVFKVSTIEIGQNGGTIWTATGEILDLGAKTITDHGFLVADQSTPDLENYDLKISLHSTSETGDFGSVISGLQPGTSYWIRAFLSNEGGTTYGNILAFETGVDIDLPAVSTSSPAAVEENSAVVGGNVSSNGGGTVSERGVFFGTEPNPTATGSKRAATTSGTGSFTVNLTGLASSQKYYYVAFATNEAGMATASLEMSFTTGSPIVLPDVTTIAAIDIQENAATVGGNVVNSGGGTVSERGIYYGTGSNPQSNGTKVAVGNGIGEFVYTLSGLDPGQTYYFVAYATNEAGTATGSILNFDTKDNTVTDYDGNIYQTVVIGSQTWMAENLKVTHYANGTEIPYISSATAFRALNYTDRGYSFYDNSGTNGDIYGGLYNWAAAMNGEASSAANPSGVQGVCPDGWHLPSDEEWKQMEMHLGLTRAEADAEGERGSDEGGKMKETGTAHWRSPNTGATNESGFTALGTGSIDYFGQSYYNLNGGSLFWSSTQSDPNYSFSHGLGYDTGKVKRFRNSIHGNGFPVRCLKD